MLMFFLCQLLAATAFSAEPGCAPAVTSLTAAERDFTVLTTCGRYLSSADRDASPADQPFFHFSLAEVKQCFCAGGQGAKAAGVGTWAMVRHPIKTVEGLGHLVAHASTVLPEIKNHLETKVAEYATLSRAEQEMVRCEMYVEVGLGFAIPVAAINAIRAVRTAVAVVRGTATAAAAGAPAVVAASAASNDAAKGAAKAAAVAKAAAAPAWPVVKNELVTATKDLASPDRARQLQAIGELGKLKVAEKTIAKLAPAEYNDPIDNAYVGLMHVIETSPDPAVQQSALDALFSYGRLNTAGYMKSALGRGIMDYLPGLYENPGLSDALRLQIYNEWKYAYSLHHMTVPPYRTTAQLVAGARLSALEAAAAIPGRTSLDSMDLENWLGYQLNWTQAFDRAASTLTLTNPANPSAKIVLAVSESGTTPRPYTAAEREAIARALKNETTYVTAEARANLANPAALWQRVAAGVTKLDEKKMPKLAKTLRGFETTNPLPPAKVKALNYAHEIGERGADGKYSLADLKRKAEILKNAGFTQDEREAILRGGVAGGPERGDFGVDQYGHTVQWTGDYWASTDIFDRAGARPTFRVHDGENGRVTLPADGQPQHGEFRRDKYGDVKQWTGEYWAKTDIFDRMGKAISPGLAKD